MQDHIVEVGFEEFMQEFLPGRDPSDEARTQFENFECVKLDGLEVDMYPGLCKSFQSVLDVVPEGGLTVKDTGEYPDVTGTEEARDKNITRFDIGIYPTSEAAKEAYNIPWKRLKRGKSSASRKYYVARVSWAWTCVPIEVKNDYQKSAFEFKHPEKYFLRNDTADGFETLGQITEYAAQVLLRQHRLFCFMVFICKSHARLIRWDRAGAVVSAGFDYIEEPEKLHNFMYRLGKMNNVQRGYDPTVVLANPGEVEAMRRCESKLNDYHKRCLKEMMSDGWPIYKIEFKPSDVVNVPGMSPSSSRYYLVGRARSSSYSLAGRATRGYVAYDMNTERLAFLKDTWRPDSVNVHPERQVYERLYQHGVRNHVATLICGGDVDISPQKTRTQEFDDGLMGRIHYRIVVKEVGRPLEDYANVREMIIVIKHAILAHHIAWTLAEILHRDVSIGNILMDQDPDAVGYLTGTQQCRGFLNDWDLCKYKENLSEDSGRKSRSGTWQFMSALLLKYPNKPNDVSDDLESFVHIVHWLALKYHRHNLSGRRLQRHVESTYDSCDLTLSGHYVGGDQKFQELKAGLVQFTVSRNPALNELLLSLLDMCRKHYAAVDYDALNALGGGDTTDLPSELTVPDDGPLPDGFSDEPLLEAGVIAPPSDGTLLLADHTQILKIFNTVFIANRSKWVNEKLPNQFLPFAVDKSLQCSSSLLGGKRRSEESIDEPGKRPKTHGPALDLRSQIVAPSGSKSTRLPSLLDSIEEALGSDSD
ncbi:hypothetical protein SCP_0309550 [Sparassis crispa]|uniref:Fungal-type protein kinase domain-containing protein n=1 Tax=Sparassis crispa TaxID=139825 RepID=A0A401GGC0_9APHY|nr:hypothetical protein SCP_0309550 [Sparassis crispa]GBE81228.1 hypothetical protein SCP_0309550 [Sparassis crispa]